MRKEFPVSGHARNISRAATNRKLSFRLQETLAMRRVTPKSHILSDEWLTCDMSALQSLYGGHFADKTKYSFPLHSIKASFIWRKVVSGKRVTLSAESTSANVYIRKKLTPLPEPAALAHALIVSP